MKTMSNLIIGMFSQKRIDLWFSLSFAFCPTSLSCLHIYECSSLIQPLTLFVLSFSLGYERYPCIKTAGRDLKTNDVIDSSPPRLWRDSVTQVAIWTCWQVKQIREDEISEDVSQLLTIIIQFIHFEEITSPP